MRYRELASEWCKNTKMVSLTKSNTITLPKWIRKECSIYPNHLLDIFIDSNTIIVRKSIMDGLENQIVMNSNGSIYIPKEIRNLQKIDHGSVFHIYYNRDMKTIKLIKITSNFSDLNVIPLQKIHF